MTQDEMITKLRAHIYTNHKSAKEYAQKLNLSTTFISAVLNKKKNPNKDILNDIGLTMRVEKTVEKVITFNKVKQQ